MSEIRKTTTIQQVEAPPPEPMISLAEVLAGIGWLAINGTILACKGSVLAYKGIRAASQSIREARETCAVAGEIAQPVRDFGAVQETIVNLAADQRLEIPRRQAEQLRLRLEKLAASNNKTGALALASELLASRQDRLQQTVLKLTAESCREIGLTNVNISSATGLVIAKSADGQRTFTVDVEKTRDGGVRMHRDSDGFHGGTCAPVHDAFDQAMRSKGVRFNTQERRRKHPRGAYDGGRLPGLVQLRK
jgi:hypothetical protein